MCVLGNSQSRIYQEDYIKYQLELISTGVFHTICQCKATIGFSKIETLVPNRLRDKTVLKYCIISATRRKGRIKMHVH